MISRRRTAVADRAGKGVDGYPPRNLGQDIVEKGCHRPCTNIRWHLAEGSEYRLPKENKRGVGRDVTAGRP